jgi:VWFA-related protein
MRPALEVVLALTSVLAVCALPPLAAQTGERDVYVTVLDKGGSPIADLTADYFAVREDGRDRAVVRAEPFRGTSHVAVLVDTSSYVAGAAGPYRNAIEAFVTKLAQGNQVAIYEFGERANRLVAFTDDGALLKETVGRISARASDVSRLLDAVDLACRDLRAAEARRPIIVTISTGAIDASTTTGGAVVKRLIQGAVSLHAVSVPTGASPSAPSLTSASGQSIPERHQRLSQVGSAGEGERERTQVLREGTSKTAGGLHEVTSALAIGPALDRVYADIRSTYRLSYAREGGGKSRDLQVGLMLEGVVVRAIAAPDGAKSR